MPTLPHPAPTLPNPAPQYWWVWVGLGAALASTVINVAIFILAATFLKGAWIPAWTVWVVALL